MAVPSQRFPSRAGISVTILRQQISDIEAALVVT